MGSGSVVAIAAESDLPPVHSRNIWHDGPLCGHRQQIIHAATIGSLATRVFQCAADGRVAAVFRQSFYVDIAGSWICIVRYGVGNGPINVVLKNTPGHVWPLEIKVGNDVQVSRSELLVGEGFTVHTGLARRWSPPPVPASSLADLARGLNALAAAVQGRIPRRGLGSFLTGSWPSSGAPLEALKARASVRALCGWLWSGSGSDLEVPMAVSTLVGLGPGLTPSGDDFLGGALIALARLRREDLACRLYWQIQPDLPSRTGAISRAHLSAAAAGEGLEALHAALDAVLTGASGSIGQRLSEIDRIGHCSGWDALAGAVTVLRSAPRIWSRSEATVA